MTVKVVSNLIILTCGFASSRLTLSAAIYAAIYSSHGTIVITYFFLCFRKLKKQINASRANDFVLTTVDIRYILVKRYIRSS